MNELIYDRTEADVLQAEDIVTRLTEGTATETERAEWLSGTLRGAMNADDLNRIEQWTAYLAAQLRGYGYAVVITPRAAQPGTPQPQAVEYIESSGTQYIDTGFMPNQDTRVVVDIEITKQTTASVCIIGARVQSSSTAAEMFNFWSMNTGTTVRSDYFGTNQSKSFSAVGNRLTIDKNKNVCTFDSNTLTNTAASGSVPLNLYVLTCNNAGAVNASYNVMAKLYACKIYDNGVLVRDYLPYYDANGVACLYDAVNDSFAYNAGSGVFTASESFIVPSHTDWTREDFPTRREVDRIRRNVDALQAGFYSIPDWREIVYNNKLDFNQANAIEWDLDRIYVWLERMVAAFAYATEIYGGESDFV